MNNFIKVLRSKSLAQSKETATQILKDKLSTLTDGELCIVSYGASSAEAKSLLGFTRLINGQHINTIVGDNSDDDGKKYYLYQLSKDEVTALGDSTIKEAYQLYSYTGEWETATDKATVGSVIKVYNGNVSENYVDTKYVDEFETLITNSIWDGSDTEETTDDKTDAHVKANNTIDEAFKKAETTIGVLATKVIENEEIAAQSLIDLAKSAGTLSPLGKIEYIQHPSANYIANASSLDDAIMKLDAAVEEASQTGGSGIEGDAPISASKDETTLITTVSLKYNSSKGLSVDSNGLGVNVKSNGGLSVDSNGLGLSDELTINCGEY